MLARSPTPPPVLPSLPFISALLILKQHQVNTRDTSIRDRRTQREKLWRNVSLLLKKAKSAPPSHLVWQQPQQCSKRWSRVMAWWAGTTSMVARFDYLKESSSAGGWKSPLLLMPAQRLTSGPLLHCAVPDSCGWKHPLTRSWTL